LNTIQNRLQDEIASIKDGMFKDERIIASPQSSDITLKDGSKVLNFCANNYLGLSNHPEVVAYAKDHIEKCGFGMSSVRFICGTQTAHRELELKLSEFLQMDDTILFPSCFDANGDHPFARIRLALTLTLCALFEFRK
jgi:glycine C-acetyltransferase